jgi:hypothetical protein
MIVGLAPGYGTTNYVLLPEFLELQRTNRLNPNSSDLLIKTITDKYFDAVRTGEDADPPAVARPQANGNPAGGPAMGPGGGRGGPQTPRGGGRGGPGQAPPPGPGGIGEGLPGSPDGSTTGNEPNDPSAAESRKKAALEMKAQATAWALTYFLSRTRIEGLYKFYQELARMPRDLPLDDSTVKLTFARCFNLLAADGKTIDAAALKLLADEWVDHMNHAPNIGKEIALSGSPTAGGPGRPAGGPGGQGGPS